MLPRSRSRSERGQQRPVVALVQADRRFVEHVEHAGQVRADLRGKTDALPFAAGQRRRTPSEREVSHADVVQEPEAIANLPEDSAGDQRFAIGELETLEYVQRFGDRQVDVFGHRPTLDPDRATLRLQPRTLTGRTRSEGAIRLEPFLLDPAALFVAASQVRHETLEAGAKRILPFLAARARPVEEQIAGLLRQPLERERQIDPEMLAERRQGLLDELSVALGPRCDRAILERERIVGYESRGIEIVDRAQPLAVRARAVRRVEGKGARRHLRHADTAVGAGQPPGEQSIAAVERVDDDDVVRKIERDFDRLGETSLDTRFEHQAIDNHFYRVIAATIELDVFVERSEGSVHANAREAAGAQGGELLLELALPSPHDRRKDVHALVVGREHDHVDDPLERLRGNLPSAQMAVRHSDVGEEQSEIVVDFRDRTDRRSRVRSGRLLLDGDRRRQAVDQSRRRASPSARETDERRTRATRRSAAVPRRKSCRRRATTSPIPKGR